MHLLDIVALLSQAGRAYTRCESRQAQVVAEVGKSVVRERFESVIASSDNGTVLQISACDGTPIQVSDACAAGLPSGLVIRRNGKATFELLCATSFVRVAAADGSYVDALEIRDPVPLTNGKKVDEIVSAARAGWKTLRERGHRGICIQAYVFDRAGISALERRFRQLHKLLSGVYSTDVESSDILWHRELVIVVACAFHDAQNSMKWALAELSDREATRDLYIGISSCRNAFSSIRAYTVSWLSSCLSFAEPWGTDEASAWRYTWELCGLKDQVIVTLMQLELRCVSGILYVSNTHSNRIELGHDIHCCLFAVWRFIVFSESRWLKAGLSCRFLLASQLLGLDHMVSFTLALPQVSGFYLNGFSRLHCRWKLIVKIALVSLVPDAAHIMLFQDARVALHAPEIKTAMLMQLDRLVNASHSTWCILSTVANVAVATLRHEVITASHCAVAFFEYRVLSVASKLPFSLCRGSVIDNITQLRDGPKPVEENSGKIWELANRGYPMSEILRVIQLIGDISWSTSIVEQLHASAAVVARLHPELHLEQLLARTTISYINKLLPTPSKAEKVADRLRSRLNNLIHKNPYKAGGRHEYVRDLSDLACVSTARGLTSIPKRNVFRKIIKKHGKLYKAKTALDKQRLTLRARARAQAAAAEINDERVRVMTKLNETQLEIENSRRMRHPLTVAGAQWDDSTVSRCEYLLSSSCFARGTVERFRAAACRAPDSMSDGLKNALDEETLHESPLKLLPDWANEVARKRDDFADTALLLHRDGRVEVPAIIASIALSGVVYYVCAILSWLACLLLRVLASVITLLCGYMHLVRRCVYRSLYRIHISWQLG